MAETQAVLMLGVSGLRGVIGQSLAPEVAARYGAALGEWLVAQNQSEQSPLVVVGRDSRVSGPMIQMAAVSGLLSTGCRVTDVGIATTPGVGVMVSHLRAAGGLVVTASHNPKPWNGLKPLTSYGAAPPAQQAREIIARFHAATQGQSLKFVDVDHVQPTTLDASTPRVHVDKVLPLLNTQAIGQRKLKVVLHSVHGAGGPETALMLRELGVELIHLYAEPTGQFPHAPEPVRENLGSLCDAVKQHGADAGFAQDPDADRLAIVDETGRYIGEEYTLALSALHVLAQHRKNIASPVLVTNLSTSRMLDDVAQRSGARVIRTSVGEANVVAAMRQHDALLGGEGNGGAIWPVITYVRDSVAGIGLILEMLALRNKTLSQVVAEIPSYSIVKDKFALQPGQTERMLVQVKQHFAAQKIDTQDGVRVDWSDRWVHIRPSNTEPIVRIIVEAHDEPAARSLVAEVRKAIGM